MTPSKIFDPDKKITSFVEKWLPRRLLLIIEDNET